MGSNINASKLGQLGSWQLGRGVPAYQVRGPNKVGLGSARKPRISGDFGILLGNEWLIL